MHVPSVIFREYDIRGVVDRELTPDVAHGIGRAVATRTARAMDRAPRLVVGRDNRPSGERLARAVRDGIALTGATAIDIGTVPTPALYLALHELDVDGGIQVTGSHNPPEFNGFKMVALGETLHGPAIQELRAMIERDDTVQGNGSLAVNDSMLDRYVDAITQRNGPLARPIKVVVDCGNGVTSLVAERTLRGIGAEVVPLFCESDGTFPNHHPDPTVLKNLRDLQERVRGVDAELGIAFDGDGDRIGAVDENGTVVYGDQLLVLLGRHLAEHAGPGHPVIFDVKCSMVLEEGLRRVGLRPEMWKTGHSLIKARMKELHAPLAGEMSGHMFFGGDYYGFDDALFAAARLLTFLGGRPGPLSVLLADLPQTYTTPELRVDCSEAEKFTIVARAAEHFGRKYATVTIDGVRIVFANGWGLLRASNTQPALVLRFEATSEADLARYRGEVEDWLRAQGVSPGGA
ncbi:MAG TPA: phosphomannomutase/phosphoglucomutase [Gemmatimonadales bacterium]